MQSVRSEKVEHRSCQTREISGRGLVKVKPPNQGGAAGVGSVRGCFDDLGLRTKRARRRTVGRRGLLAASGSAFPTEDLWRELQAVDPGIGRATVYRTVELLQREGLLDRVAFSNGTHRYRLCGDSHHHHVNCA